MEVAMGITSRRSETMVWKVNNESVIFLFTGKVTLLRNN